MQLGNPFAKAGITVAQFGEAMRRLGSSPEFKEFYMYWKVLYVLTMPDYVIKGKRKPILMRICDWCKDIHLGSTIAFAALIALWFFIVSVLIACFIDLRM